MIDDTASQETTIVATYSTRRDAEMAQERLDETGIEAFIRADDAGGMHPQLQLPHGVQLVTLEREVDRTHAVLRDAGLLPSRPGLGHDDETTSTEPSNLTFTSDRPLFSATGIAYLVVFALLVLGLMIAVAL